MFGPVLHVVRYDADRFDRVLQSIERLVAKLVESGEELQALGRDAEKRRDDREARQRYLEAERRFEQAVRIWRFVESRTPLERTLKRSVGYLLFDELMGSGADAPAREVLAELIEIARRFEAREEAPSSYRLAEEFGATDHQMLGVLRRLEDMQLVKEIGGDWTGFVPGGDPDRITVDEVIRCIEGAERRVPDGPPDDPATTAIAGLFSTLDGCTRDAMGSQSIGRMVRELYGTAAPSRAADPVPG